MKVEGSLGGDLGCFVNLPYFLVRYVVVPVMDCVSVVCAYVCVCVCVCVCGTHEETVEPFRSV